MEEHNSPIVLYDFFASNCAWRVRNVLYFKGLPYETRSINLQKGRATSWRFPAYQPIRCRSGTLHRWCFHYVFITICEYLEETRPHPPIFPSDPYQRAQVRRIVEIINSYLVPLQNPTTAKKYSKDPNEQQAWSMDFFTKGFAVLEKILAETSGRYAVGHQVTFADMCLVPQVWRAKRITTDFSPYPNILRINQELLKLPSFRLAHAVNHSQCPPDIQGKFC